jgi:hypothetical protein
MARDFLRRNRTRRETVRGLIGSSGSKRSISSVSTTSSADWFKAHPEVVSYLEHIAHRPREKGQPRAFGPATPRGTSGSAPSRSCTQLDEPFRPPPAVFLRCHVVSTAVNSALNDNPALARPLTPKSQSCPDEAGTELLELSGGGAPTRRSQTVRAHAPHRRTPISRPLAQRFQLGFTCR